MAGSPLQIVPSRVCLQCDVCCRFPERDSFLRPYFSAEERSQAIAAGLSADVLPHQGGGQVELVPHPHGEGYLCPAFDPTTAHCRIYESRPLDCRLYPFALMWDAAGKRVLLGWDAKCPYLLDSPPPGLDQAAEQLTRWLEEDTQVDLLARNPRLVGRFQDDIVGMRKLDRVTERLTSLGKFHRSWPLRLQDRDRFESAARLALRGVEQPLAAYSFAYHYMWRRALAYSWREVKERFCLFGHSPDGLFLALPPLGEGPIASSLAEAFRGMKEENQGRPVTRVEHLPAELVAEVRALGYRVTALEPDYVYEAAAMADLSGDAYKSQRAACNRFVREQAGRFERYRSDDRHDCLALFRDWVGQKHAAGADDYGRALLEDAAGAHEEALSEHAALGLIGGVVRVGGRICAYTLGTWLTPAVFCVLIEVADRTVTGLGPFIFREFCRQARADGALWVNTMDDSGLPHLAKSKHLYHPTHLLPNYCVTES
ncbi:MAG: DUF2156 domain-containing protein [Nitrospiraceae bacterium]|nr:DUF2156 domain-containing protein [Nitrospiraceae bacterium]